MILGLDISTTAVGVCVLTNTGDVKLLSFIRLGKQKTLFSKAAVFKETLNGMVKDFNITRVVIEENLQAFRPGFSSAKTIVSLARFNGVCSYISAEIFGIDPEFVNVNAARKLAGIKIDRKIKKSTKEQILEFVHDKEPGLGWPTKTLKGGPRKGSVILVKECYDMADAYVVAHGALARERHCLEQRR